MKKDELKTSNKKRNINAPKILKIALPTGTRSASNPFAQFATTGAITPPRFAPKTITRANDIGIAPLLANDIIKRTMAKLE